MIGVRVRLTFPDELVRQPIVARLVSELGVMANIRRADVGEHEGWMVCELEGDPDAVDRGLGWLRTEGVQVDLLGDIVES
ncbi:MAG: NIL domain-containing protein [Actinomycetota bacterium]|jgi:ABC-type methionine transport system ATPase subunit|nr:NIL domain-containing protein [Actinomycetota bacterium]MDA8294772.1 NIL domain-containing protein [Actinomycetota bacterium]